LNFTSPTNYSLPEIFDFNNDNYSVTFYNLPEFVSFNESSLILTYDFDSILQNDVMNYTVLIKLEDVRGKSKNYTL